MSFQTILNFYRSYGLFISIAVGCFCPFLHVISEQYFALLLMPMLFFVFVRLRAPFHAFHWSHLPLLLWNLLFPCAVFWTLRALGFSADVAMGGFMAAVSPTGTAAPVVMTFLAGKMEFVVIAFLLTTLGFTFLIPFLFPLFYGVETPGLSFMILEKVAGVVLIPMVLAVLCRLIYPRSEEWGYRAKDFSFLLWQCLIILICSKMSFSLWENHELLYHVPECLIIAAAVCFLNFAAGYVFCGRKFAREASQALGQKNCGLTILVAITYANPLVVLCPSLYIMCHNSWNAIQIARHERPKAQKTKPMKSHELSKSPKNAKKREAAAKAGDNEI